MNPCPSDIREKLDALYVRCDKGFAILFQREQAGQMDATYASWLSQWQKLLAEYELALDRLGLTK